MSDWKNEDRFEFSPEEEGNDILVLTLEDGTEEEFEVLSEIEYQGDNYVVLLPMDEEECEEVIIVKVIDQEAQIYESVDDDDTLTAVFAAFQESIQDILDLEDEE